MSWKNVDLNLLIIFDALMTERNVTRAGLKIGLSQPAVSAALAKLRLSFKDELFIREAGGVRPTPRAVELSEKFKGILTSIESALNDTEFDPQTQSLSLKLEMDPYSQLCLLPGMYAFLRKEAPNVNLRLKSNEIESRGDSTKFETDLIFSTSNIESYRANSVDIMTDDYVVCTNKKIAGKTMTIEEFCSSPHIEVPGLTPHRSIFDRHLEPLSLYRGIQFRMTFMLTAMHMLRQEDLMCVLPRKVVSLISQTNKRTFYELPFEIPPLRVKMACSPAFSDCDFYDWLLPHMTRIIELTFTKL